MNCNHLHNELPEITKQGMARPKLKMVMLNHIKYKPVRSNACPLVKNGKAYQPKKTKDKDDEEAVYYDTSDVPTPTASLLPSISRTGRDTTTSRPLATWMSLPSLLSEWGFLAKEIPLDSATGFFCTVKWNPVHGLASPPLLEWKDWDKPMEDCCCACARHQFLWPYRQASQEEPHPWDCEERGIVKSRSHTTAWRQK